MSNSNDFFMNMCKEAMQELAAGDKGWKDVDTNTLFLAAFGMLFNHMASKVVRPLWVLAFTVFAGVIAGLIILGVS